MTQMTKQEFDTIVYPTIGKITSAQHLKNVLNEILRKDFIVPRQAGYTTINQYIVNVPYDVFYCYVSEQLYTDWRVNNESHPTLNVYFEMKSSVYRVTVSSKKY